MSKGARYPKLIVDLLGVQAFCPVAKDYFIWSAKTRRELFKR